MAQKESKGYLLYILLIPGIIAFAKMAWDFFKTSQMTKALSNISLKDDNKIRTQRNLYKKTLESAILKAADRIQNKDKMNKDEITAYKDEKAEDELIDSYKKEI